MFLAVLVGRIYCKCTGGKLLLTKSDNKTPIRNDFSLPKNIAIKSLVVLVGRIQTHRWKVVVETN